ESLASSAQGLKRLREAHAAAREAASGSSDTDQDASALRRFRAEFAAALNDDLNTPRAIAALFDAAREVRRALDDGAGAGYAAAAAQLLEELLDGVLGVPVVAPGEGGGVAEALEGVVELLLTERQRARERRD